MIERIMKVGDMFIDCLTIVDIQAEGRPCVYVNKKFEEVTGYTREEVVGKNLSLLQGAETSTEVTNYMRECFQQKQACIQDIINYKKDGTVFNNRLLMLPFRNSKGKTFYLGLQNDVTEKFREVNNSKLQEVQSAEICHFINNRLTALLYKIESMVKNDLNDEELKEQAAEIMQWLKAINEFSVEIAHISEFGNFKYP